MKNIKIYIFFKIFIVQFIYSQNSFIDTSFGTNSGYTLGVGGPFVDIIEINGEYYTSSQGFSDWGISKFNSNGLLSTSFGTNGSITINDDEAWTINAYNVSSLKKTNDNKLLLVNGSYPTSYPLNNRILISKINLNGTLDTTYGVNGHSYNNDLTYGIKLIGNYQTENDDIIFIGYNTSLPPNSEQFITIFKITNQGLFDNTFGINGVINLPYNYQSFYPVQAIYKNHDVYMLFNNSFGNAYMTKYNISNLNYDMNFGLNGVLEIEFSNQNENANSFTIDNSNNIYVSGSISTGEQYNLFICKYSNNTLDLNFGNNGIVENQFIPNSNSIAQPYSTKIIDGKLLLMGESYNWDTAPYVKTFFARFNLLDGTLDNSFGINGKIINYLFNTNNYSYDYLYLNDSIITCGFCPNNNTSKPCLVKYLFNANLNTDEYNKSKLIAYPNPVDKTLYLNSDLSFDYAEIIDYTGRLINTFHLKQNEIDFSYLPAGIYFLRAKSKNKQFNLKVVKN
ncbi:T9SS type A sorting domain-containing protein [Flavobacterium aurantiibacter]|uniref:Secretion system C-terminal sorting domain-containing protein n=1 Tax=Flavobacterium aurantiibacter TaxID=2023067 RepID=A0A255ZSQ6_9FLAO|nr:T9SS type A sorting domain-containing protein [Flavobacterium aurantiibacter]OYQ44419.1 hypothetical protein CHX27_07390 [Flavobacterium aurantiibacter]